MIIKWKDKIKKRLEDPKQKFFIIMTVFLAVGMLLLTKMAFGIGFQWEKIDPGYLGYQRIIFVGDSRTLAMERCNTYKNVEFVGDYGKGLNWFKKEGYDRLMELLKKNNSPQPIALVFNLGVNDYKYNSEKYVPYFQRIAQRLRDENCYLFYMSVNPVDEEKLEKNTEYTMRTNEEIQIFNQKLQDGLKEDYIWLDMSTALVKKGFSTREGLHYSSATSVYILSRGIQMVMNANAYLQEYCWRRRAGNWYALRWEDNSVVKNAWIQDGEGEFYLDEDGHLLREQELVDENGNMCMVGNSGRRIKADVP